MALFVGVAVGWRTSEKAARGSTGVLGVRSSLYLMPKRWARPPLDGRSGSWEVEVVERVRRDWVRWDCRQERHMDDRRRDFGRAIVDVVD
jgi:hypothetical protein